MNILKTRQPDKENLFTNQFDLFITCSGYESRARHLVEMYHDKIKARRKYCLKFNNHQQYDNRRLNDESFAEHGFTMEECSGNDDTLIKTILDDTLNSTANKILNILVDYSSMTRIWYAAIIKYFKLNSLEDYEVNLFFSYSSSIFAKPPNAVIYNRYVGPIDGFYTLSIPSKPTALIIGLGYIESRSYGLSEFFDVEPYVLIADSSSSTEYFAEVILNNRNLLRSLNENHIFHYPLNNLLYSETLLYSISKDLLSDYRLVLAPCGPKPFTLLCLIMSMRSPGIDVWRISAGEDELPIDKIASGNLAILQLTLKGLTEQKDEQSQSK